MRKYLFLLFLGIWIAVIPFLPIQRGSTQTATLVVTGFIIVLFAVLSLRETHTP